jgi:hypothetical protein
MESTFAPVTSDVFASRSVPAVPAAELITVCGASEMEKS